MALHGGAPDAKGKGLIWLSATCFRRSYFLCFGGADRMAFASFL